MPTHNGEQFVAQALNSIEAQGPSVLDELEIIAVEDGSTDATDAILQAARARLPLQVLRPPPARNWVSSTNAGFARATGRYLCTLHQDDVWFPGRVQRLRQLTRELPEAQLFVHPVSYIDASGARVGNWDCPLPPDRARVASALFIERLLVQNFISMPAPLFRRELVEAVGGMQETYWYTADWDFWLSLAEQTPQVGYLNQALAGYRLHPAAQTNRRSADSDAFRAELVRALETHLARWEQGAPPNREEVRRAAYFSVEANVYLASRAHGKGRGGAALAGQLLTLGPSATKRYLRDSRIRQRVSARLRALGRGLGG